MRRQQGVTAASFDRSPPRCSKPCECRLARPSRVGNPRRVALEPIHARASDESRSRVVVAWGQASASESGTSRLRRQVRSTVGWGNSGHAIGSAAGVSAVSCREIVLSPLRWGLSPLATGRQQAKGRGRAKGASGEGTDRGRITENGPKSMPGLQVGWPGPRGGGHGTGRGQAQARAQQPRL